MSTSVKVDSQKALVSIIVPAYNTEQYLSACVESILNQTHEVLELIIVDDGSTDTSGEIAREFASKDSRVRVLSQENRGVAAARNRGRMAATGQFVYFVDSDDSLHPDTIRFLMDTALRDNADVVIHGFRHLGQGEEPAQTQLLRGPAEVVLGKDAQIRLLYGEGVLPSAGGKLIRADLAKETEFPENIRYAEDFAFSYRLLGRAPRVAITKVKAYSYRDREGSAMNLEFSPHRISSLTVPQAFLEEIAPYDSVRKRGLEQKIFMAGLAVLAAAGSDPRWTEQRRRAVCAVQEHKRNVFRDSRASWKRARLFAFLAHVSPTVAVSGVRTKVWVNRRLGLRSRQLPRLRCLGDTQGKRPKTQGPRSNLPTSEIRLSESVSLDAKGEARGAKPPLLSVIVPVYNGAEYLQATLDSILEQSYNHLEVIVIDDGSTDSSLTIARCIGQRDERVRVIHQSNSGVSRSRNLGVSESTGDYICFVDADDLVPQSAMGDAVSLAMAEAADVVIQGVLAFERSVPDPKMLFGQRAQTEQLTGRQAAIELLYGREITWGPCAKLISRRIALHNQFPEDLAFGEDLAYLYDVLMSASRVMVSKNVGYCYRQHDGSVTKMSFRTSRKGALVASQEILSSIDPNDHELHSAAQHRVFRHALGVLSAIEPDFLDWPNETEEAVTLMKTHRQGIRRRRAVGTSTFPVFSALSLLPKHVFLASFTLSKRGMRISSGIRQWRRITGNGRV